MSDVRLPPVTPKALAKLRRLMTHYTSSMNDIVETVYSDPGLTVWVVGEGNSERLGFERLVANVPQALLLIGFAQLRQFACQRGQFNPGESQRIAADFGHASYISTNAGQWVKILSSRFENGQYTDVFRTALIAWAAATACVSLDRRIPPVLDPEQFKEAPENYFDDARKYLAGWNFPDDLIYLASRISSTPAATDEPINALTFGGYVLETALQLAHAVLPAPEMISDVLSRNPVWNRLGDRMKENLIRAGMDHCMNRIKSIS